LLQSFILVTKNTTPATDPQKTSTPARGKCQEQQADEGTETHIAVRQDTLNEICNQR
jgi:hypothetical protein